MKISDKITLKEAANITMGHEGLRLKVYIDTVGVPTVGYGHALHVGSVIPKEAADIIFLHDYNNAVKDLNDVLPIEHITGPVRLAALTDMMFNLGKTRFCGFKKMIKAVKNNDYKTAAKEAKNSKWYTQVKTRGERIVKMIETGLYTEE